MNIREVSSTSVDSLTTLLSAIPFYKAVKKQDEEQFHTLMGFSRIFEYDSGEKVLSRGDVESWSYFIVKGQLVVSAPDQHGIEHCVNYLSPGEVLGDLSVFLHSPRTANVYVDTNCRQAVLFGTDFGAFGDLMNFSQVSLATKLLYYRHATHSIRWKLEMYRSKYREHPMANQHRHIKLYTGEKGGKEELQGLHQQASELAALLVKWNQNFGNISFTETALPPITMTI